jgi:hypothetical protein
MTLCHSSTFRALLAATSLLAASLGSSAALLVEDGFLDTEYASGSDLVDGEGGTGFGGPWDPQTSASNTILSSSLTFGALPVAGNKLEIDTTGSPALVYRPLGSTITGGGHPTVWLGFLLKKTVSSGADDYFEFQLLASNGTGLAIGDLGGTDNYSLHDVDTASGGLQESGIQSMLGDTVWLVVKVSFTPGLTSQNDNFKLFVNPSPTGSEPNAADAEKSDFNLSNIASIGYLASAGQTWQLDGIRVGDSYSDLVPEPATAGMLGLGAGLLGMRRRRAA